MVAQGHHEWLGSGRGRRVRRRGDTAEEGFEYRLVHGDEHCRLFGAKSHHSRHVCHHEVVGDIFIVPDIGRDRVGSGGMRIHQWDWDIACKGSRGQWGKWGIACTQVGQFGRSRARGDVDWGGRARHVDCKEIEIKAAERSFKLLLQQVDEEDGD